MIRMLSRSRSTPWGYSSTHHTPLHHIGGKSNCESDTVKGGGIRTPKYPEAPNQESKAPLHLDTKLRLVVIERILIFSEAVPTSSHRNLVFESQIAWTFRAKKCFLDIKRAGF